MVREDRQREDLVEASRRCAAEGEPSMRGLSELMVDHAEVRQEPAA